MIRDTGTDNVSDVTSRTVLGVDQEVGIDHSGQEASNSQSNISVMDSVVYETAIDVPIGNCGSSENTYSNLEDSADNAPGTIDEVLFSDSVDGDDSFFALQYGNLNNTSHSESYTESSDDTVTARSNCESDSEFYSSPAKSFVLCQLAWARVFLSAKLLSYNS